MTNEQLEKLKTLALAIADAIPPKMLDEVRRSRAALTALDPPAEPETSEPSFVGDRGVAWMTTQWATPIMRELAREVQAWREVWDNLDLAGFEASAYAKSLENFGFEAAASLIEACDVIRRRSKGE